MNTSELSAQIRDCVDGGASPITATEIKAKSPISERHRLRVPRQRRALLGAAVTGVTAAGVATALIASQGGGTAAVLTAATLKQMADASTAAMNSGEAHIVWAGPGSTVVQDVTFDGANWNDVVNPGQPRHLQHTTQIVNTSHGKVTERVTRWTGESVSRVVDGQSYRYPALPLGGSSQATDGWVHLITPGAGGPLNIPDPRSLVRVLSPSAGFVPDGSATLNGVGVRHLRATTPGAVALQPLDDVIQSEPDNARVSALDLWVDSSGVVLKAQLTVSGTSGTGVPQSVTVTVTFSDIGQPQSIPTPAPIVQTLGGKN